MHTSNLAPTRNNSRNRHDWLAVHALNAFGKVPPLYLATLAHDIRISKVPKEVDQLLKGLFNDIMSNTLSHLFYSHRVAAILKAAGRDTPLGKNLAWIAWDLGRQGFEFYGLRQLGSALEALGHSRPRDVSLSPISGFAELSLNAQSAFVTFQQKIESSLAAFGAAHLQLPLATHKETVQDIGKRSDLIQLLDIYGNGRNNPLRGVVLTPEHTIGMVRFVSQHMHEMVFPYFSYQLGPVFRAERVLSHGHLCEFYQADLDIVSNIGLDLRHDAKIALRIALTLAAVGVNDTLFRVSNRKIIEGALSAYGVTDNKKINTVIKALDGTSSENRAQFLHEANTKISSIRPRINLPTEAFKFLWELRGLKGSSRELGDKIETLGNKLPRHNVQALKMFLSGAADLKTVLSYLEKSKRVNCVGDPSLARTCPIYSGTEYEVTWLRHPHIGSIAAGGRYDHLATKIAGQFLAGVGMCIGASRIFHQLMEDKNVVPTSTADLLVTLKDRTNVDPKQLVKIELAGQHFRDAGFRVLEVEPSDIVDHSHLKRLAAQNQIAGLYFADTGELIDRVSNKRRTTKK